MKKESYTTPRIKVVHFCVEHGFAGSSPFEAAESSTTDVNLFATEAVSQNGDVIGRDDLTRY